MQQSTNTKEQLNTPSNVNEAFKPDYSMNEDLIYRHQIPGSPYWIIGSEDEGFTLRFGKYRLTEILPTAEDIEAWLENNKWNIMLQTMLAVINENETKPADGITIDASIHTKK